MQIPHDSPRSTRIKCLKQTIGQRLGAKSFSLVMIAVSSAVSPAQAEVDGSFGYNTANYLSPVGSSSKNVFSTLNLDLTSATRGKYLEAGLDGQLSVGVQCTDCNSVEFKQVYMGSPKSAGPVQVRAGRVQEHWSELDEEWRLGIFQPRFVYDNLKPENVGLSGVFADVELPGFSLTAFGSPGFIPDRGLPINFQNGGVASVDPFFHTPISEVVFEDRTTPIQYLLKRPPLQELLLQPGGGIKARVGYERGFWAQAAYAYKPINQILLAYNGLYNLSFEVADADVFPRVLYHHAATVESGFKSRYFSGWISMIREVPVRDETPAIWTTQEITPSLAVSPSFEIRMADSAGAPRMSVSFLRQWGGNGNDQGPQAVDGGTAFNLRYPFQSAIQVHASTPAYGSLGRHLTLSSDLLFDLQHASNIVSGAIRYRPGPRWTMSLSGDVLNSNRPGGTDFIARNRANDRYQGGIAYEF